MSPPIACNPTPAPAYHRRTRRVGGRARGAPGIFRSDAGRSALRLRRDDSPVAASRVADARDPAARHRDAGSRGAGWRPGRTRPRLRSAARPADEHRQRVPARRTGSRTTAESAPDRSLHARPGGRPAGTRGGHRLQRHGTRWNGRPEGDPGGGWADARAGPGNGAVPRHALQRDRRGCGRRRPERRQHGPGADRLPGRPDTRRARVAPDRRAGGRRGGRRAAHRSAEGCPRARARTHRPGVPLVPAGDAASALAAAHGIAVRCRCRCVSRPVAPVRLRTARAGQGLPDQRHGVLPAARRLAHSRRRRPAAAVRGHGADRRARLEPGLRHRRGELHHRDAAARTAGEVRQPRPGARLRQRCRWRSATPRAQRRVPGVDGRCAGAAAAGTVLRETRQRRLRGAQGAARNRPVRAAGPRARSAVLQARPHRLPQRAHLLRAGAAGPCARALPLLAEPERLPVPRPVREPRPAGGTLRRCRAHGPDLPARGLDHERAAALRRPLERAGRLSDAGLPERQPGLDRSGGPDAPATRRPCPPGGDPGQPRWPPPLLPGRDGPIPAAVGRGGVGPALAAARRPAPARARRAERRDRLGQRRRHERDPDA